MAGASDKARFYLEKSVPELREWERKGIFTKEELIAISARRSEFEHILNARGSQPSDYARYAEYELNLETLRKKRVKRKAVKTTTHVGQRRIFFILDRATKKFHGDVGLWMQYIDYARAQKANKRLLRILTDALRMHPTRPELWIYAARYAMDIQADVDGARSYFQRGLRFCKTSQSIYLEYARIEMSYIAKIAKRRKILGIGFTEHTTFVPEINPQDELAADLIALPTLTADDLSNGKSTESAEDNSSNDLAETSAMRGAIPLAIFNSATEIPGDTIGVCESFFDLFAGFIELPCAKRLLNVVLERMVAFDRLVPATINCTFKASLLGIPHDSPDFPPALGVAIKSLRSMVNECSLSVKPVVSRKVLEWFPKFVMDGSFGPEIMKVLEATQRQLVRTSALDESVLS